MPRPQPGYTLIELMIVVMLMALITALAAPRITTAVANNTVSDAANQTVVLFRKARTDATTKRAAMRIFIPADRKLIRLDLGSDNSCFSLPTGCNTDLADDFDGDECGVKFVNLDHSHFKRRGVRIQDILLSNTSLGAGALSFCATPSGKLYQLNTAETTKALLPGPLEIVIDRVVGVTSVGVKRRVFISSTTNPRLML